MDIRKFFGGAGTVKTKQPSDKGQQTSKLSQSPKGTPAKTSKARKTNSEKCVVHPSSDKKREHTKNTDKIRNKQKDKNGNIEDEGTVNQTEVKKERKVQGVEGKKTPAKKKCTSNGSEAAECEKTSPHHQTSPKKRQLELSEEDEEDEHIVVRSKKKKRRSTRKGIIFDSESDDEEPAPKKRVKRRKKEYQLSSDEESKQASIEEAFQHVKAKPKAAPAAKTPSPRKVIDVQDFFGTSPVKSEEKKATARKRKLPSPVKLHDDDDFELHDDDDFNETLRQLDECEESEAKEIKLEKQEAKPSSLSSKLARKVKEGYMVEQTPEKPSPARTASKGTPSTPDRKPTKTSPGKSSGKPSSVQKTSPGKPETKKLAYKSYLSREGPRSLGSKEVPQGGDNCLEGLTFVITGVLESFERDEMKSIIERFGGKVTGSISKKTRYLIVGRDAGESKLNKAQSLGTKILDEDGILDLIATLPGKKSKYEIAAEKEAKSTPVRKTPSKGHSSAKSASASASQTKAKPCSSQHEDSPGGSGGAPSAQSDQHSVKEEVATSGDSLLWVDKYKPVGLKQIIGQQGDKSNAKKLLHWLRTWHKNVASGKKPAFNRFGDDGSGYRAALLSGPPGVGKTTTTHLVCKEAGFSFVELNASDTRSKRSLREDVAESLNNHSLVGIFGTSADKIEDGRFHCLVMDEVDGMAGNEDRGGIQELVGLIKSTKIPIICMCNDRSHPKIRTLANHCFDLRFQRPRVEQIKSAMMSLAFKEGLKIPPPALNDVILASNQDIRQIIHNLSMWSATDKNMTFGQVKSDANNAKKDIKLGPFDVVRKVFSAGEEAAHMTINDRSDLFFFDYSFGPLFVQENYINVQPSEAKGSVKKHLQLLSRAADSIAAGDRVERLVRGQGRWGLLPVQAIFASVIPGDVMRGYLSGQIQFPTWLGKNSTQAKNDRILQELKSHMRLRISCDKRGLNMEYLPHLRHSLTLPLINEGNDGIPDVIQCLDGYNLIKEDFDSILEVSQWPNSKDVMSMVETKTKAAFTRTYNKEVHLTPYAIGSQAKKGRRGAISAESVEEVGLGEGEEASQEQVESEEEDDVLVDNMIKKKKTPAPKVSGESGSSACKGKGKGQGKGKGRKKDKS